MTAEAEQDRRCRGETAQGEPCQARPEWVNEDGWCVSHDPSEEAADLRKRRARLGGAVTAAKNSKGIDPDELPPLDGPKSAARRADLISRAALVGRISGAQAQAGLRGINEYLKAYEAGKLKEERDELLAAVNELRRNGGRR